METIKVQSIIERDTAVSTDDGQKVHDQIQSLFSQADVIEVDFSGIQIMTTAFLNAALGQLYSSYTGDVLNSKLKLTHVSETDKVLFKKVVTRAKEYFANKADFDSSANNVLYGD
ncbi:STAS-like domain-containing protein [Reichenbachiella ulvae]|uniref:STAS-like domain-containing protein n=1 Tax=Reichenbachiella ulvae TaxID=2980104 RepID=A0ABT3CV50_9BACT|nr:STAS-like domain-containing protein [Reichenbachiella ulvae]MCV9387428.1 STAS-like domain-containing protein [Reichenbachiella ulvae]